MFEKEIFSAGIWVGYGVTCFVIVAYCAVLLKHRLSKIERYLRETKQLQKFGDWNKMNEFKLKLVKSDS